MDKEQLLRELEEKRIELEKLEKAIKEMEEEAILEPIDTSELLKEIKGYPRYFINRKGEVFHEAGLMIKTANEKEILLFDPMNNKVLVKIEDLLKDNF